MTSCGIELDCTNVRNTGSLLVKLCNQFVLLRNIPLTWFRKPAILVKMAGLKYFQLKNTHCPRNSCHIESLSSEAKEVIDDNGY